LRAGARGLSTHVENVRAVFHHLQGNVNSPVGIVEHAAVGKRIRRDVDDPHHQRA